MCLSLYQSHQMAALSDEFRADTEIMTCRREPPRLAYRKPR